MERAGHGEIDGEVGCRTVALRDRDNVSPEWPRCPLKPDSFALVVSYARGVNKRETRSPLKGAPLRMPGQSVQEMIDKVVDDEWFPLFGVAVMLVLLTFLEWFKDIFGLAPTPRLYTLMTLGFVAYTWWRWRQIQRKVRPLKLARDGERVVAECLDLVRGDGHWVFHDLVGEGFNVDHVVVGSQGIYTVETKTISKPAGDARVVFDGERVLVAGWAPDRDPVAQAQAQARWLRELLLSMTGREFPVRPVVAYPGWFVESTPSARKADVWVLEPKALLSFIRHEPHFLPKADVALIVNRLKLQMRPRAQ